MIVFAYPAKTPGIADHVKGFSPNAKKAVAQAPGLSNQDIEKHKVIEFSNFSDNFAISAPVEHGEAVFRILSWAICNLLQKRFIVREGVTVGHLYHSPEIIFGPALVEAVDIEKDAKFSRFLCSHGLIEHLDGTPYKNKVIFQDCYEDWVVNTWCGTRALLGDLMKIIQKQILHMTKDKDIRKWQYMERMLSKMYELKPE
jgi:hypothetical protein